MKFPAACRQTGMTDDEQQIRTLVGRWAAAVHDGDLPGVHGRGSLPKGQVGTTVKNS
jgi:hypothetical protein